MPSLSLDVITFILESLVIGIQVSTSSPLILPAIAAFANPVPISDAISAIVVSLLFIFRRDLMLYCFDPTHAQSIGINTISKGEILLGQIIPFLSLDCSIAAAAILETPIP